MVVRSRPRPPSHLDRREDPGDLVGALETPEREMKTFPPRPTPTVSWRKELSTEHNLNGIVSGGVKSWALSWNICLSWPGSTRDFARVRKLVL